MNLTNRRTKIFCTLGPACRDPKILKGMLENGMNVARLNFSHGDHDTHREAANTVRQVAKDMGKSIAVLLDTKGPEIRTKKLTTESIELQKGAKFILTTDDIEGTIDRVAVTHDKFAVDVAVGGRILLDDGLIELQIDAIEGNDVICTVLNNGILKANKGVNLPDVKVSLPALTEKDIADIKFGIAENFDFIAASFVRSAADVREIRELLNANGGSHIKIMSKIENREGVDNIDEILEVTDAIMVARGDMGVEIDPEEVPGVQKELIRKANRLGKTVVTATQMLESMIKNPRPTRAEVSDVANAIYDGTDAVMLSGETASGDYPMNAVAMMHRIAAQTESIMKFGAEFDSSSVTDAVSYSATAIARKTGAKAILTLTTSGYTANLVSKFKPETPLVAITPNETVLRQLNAVWGAIPLFVDMQTSRSTLLRNALEVTTTKLNLQVGDVVVVVSGLPLGVAGTTNNIRVHKIGDPAQ